MWKTLGFALVLGGVAGILYSWIAQQKRRQKFLEEFILFLEKSVGIMENGKIKVAALFEKHISYQLNAKNSEMQILAHILQKIVIKLSTNTYPNGQIVWEKVFKEEVPKMALDKETFSIVLQAANGFFGQSRDENIRFLQKSIKELETQQKKYREKDLQERKVWVPVGMLGAVMLVIILI